MAIDELCIALQMEDCKMEVDKEENSKAVDKPKTTTLGKSVIILPNIWKKPQKSGVILTSMEPNIFRMLFSIKNQKIVML